jgi:endonuclease/exonuclease/phosphatase family metal-dependent hydrolase
MDVASVNVWGLPNILHPRFGNGERLGGALGRYLEGAAHFDVVAVQELWGNLWRRDATAAHPLFPRLNIHPTSRDGDSGLAFGTAERRWHTKTAPDARPFVHRGRAADALKHKGFARVTMVADADGEPIEVVVVNTHLQATNLWNVTADAEIRGQQVRETLDALAEEARPIVWLGDFNLSEHDAGVAPFDQATGEAIHAAGFKEGADFLPEVAALPTNVDGRRYDRVWVRGSAAFDLKILRFTRHVHGGDDKRVRVVKRVSDHLPIEATVGVFRRGAPRRLEAPEPAPVAAPAPAAGAATPTPTAL